MVIEAYAPVSLEKRFGLGGGALTQFPIFFLVKLSTSKLKFHTGILVISMKDIIQLKQRTLDEG